VDAEFGQAALHSAACCKDGLAGAAIARLLIENGAVVDVQNKITV
jgi:hypothetical protein